MAITPAQVEQFKTHGFTTVPHFFDQREVKAMQAEVDRWIREGKIRNVTTEGDGKTHSSTKQNLQLIPLFNKSDLFRALPFDSKVIDTVTQLIGDPIMLHLDQMFYKPAKHGAGTSWHQDNAYFKIREPLHGTAMWIAVHDATVANGTMELLPDMFNEKLEHERDPNSDHHIRCYPDESTAVPSNSRPAASRSSATARPTAPAPTPAMATARASPCTSSTPITPTTT